MADDITPGTFRLVAIGSILIYVDYFTLYLFKIFELFAHSNFCFSKLHILHFYG
jgi:hypothetical protein